MGRRAVRGLPVYNLTTASSTYTANGYLVHNCGTPVITTACSSMEELNPDGWQVDGEPFYNGVHKSWWIRPSIGGMVRALEASYEERADVDRVKLRESVAQYEVGRVAEEHMGPAVGELLERMAARKG